MNGNYHIGLVFLDNALSLFHITHLKAFGRRPVQTAVVRSRQNRFEARVREIAFKMLRYRKVYIAFLGFRCYSQNARVYSAVTCVNDDDFFCCRAENGGGYAAANAGGCAEY